MSNTRATSQSSGLVIWGCRGSVSVGGPECNRYGGMTTCIELDRPSGRIIIDAGSGLGALGRARGVDRKPTLLLFSHLHADHVVGFPHFAPLYAPGWDLEVQGVPRSGADVFEFLLQTHRPPLFPVPMADALGPDVRGTRAEPQADRVFAGVDLAWMEVAHPGGCSAFRMDVDGTRIVFTGDLEVRATDQAALARFCQNADLLIMDAQYTEDAYQASHVGWGHSTNLQAAEFARVCGARQLVLTHHDPRHDDEKIDEMVRDASAIHPFVSAAHCGMHFDLAALRAAMPAVPAAR
jgi:phosphoribosyl 1,2-cyclic phosphodiesterase